MPTTTTCKRYGNKSTTPSRPAGNARPISTAARMSARQASATP
nr:MAG TPA: hypothetical protein [Caudoviricetes sp.]